MRWYRQQQMYVISVYRPRHELSFHDFKLFPATTPVPADRYLRPKLDIDTSSPIPGDICNPIPYDCQTSPFASPDANASRRLKARGLRIPEKGTLNRLDDGGTLQILGRLAMGRRFTPLELDERERAELTSLASRRARHRPWRFEPGSCWPVPTASRVRL